ncbi:uncharacterized protein LOC108919733 [Scleropages formosus]|nr:uncharacterized protein LOC108919733 [Scleropages formosus]
MDVEAARTPPRRSCRCLDVWLAVSVTLFYACVLVGGAVYATLDNRRHVGAEGGAGSPADLPRAIAQRADTHERHMIDGVTYLFPQSEEIMDAKVVNWTAVRYRNRTTVGSFYEYKSSSSVLKVKKEGSYLLMVSLKFTCSSSGCKQANTTEKFTLSVSCESIKFECQVDLKEGSVQQCVDILMLPDSCELKARMKHTKENLGWKLDKNASKLGIALLAMLA